MSKQTERIAYTVAEAAEELGLSRRTIMSLISTGQLVARKCGRHRGILIGRAAIEAFLSTPDPALIVTPCNNTPAQWSALGGTKSANSRGGRNK